MHAIPAIQQQQRQEQQQQEARAREDGEQGKEEQLN
jgi:hypothetical protein